MGKFATYSKRGSAEAYGSMLAPVAGDWTLTSPSSGNFSFNRISPIPAPATKWGARLRPVGGPWVLIAPAAGATISGPIGSGTTQEGQIAWFDSNNVQISPYGDIKSVVIL